MRTYERHGLAIHSGRAELFSRPGLRNPNRRRRRPNGRTGRPRGSCGCYSGCFRFPPCWGPMLVGAVFYSARSFAVDPDLWWHIRVGQDIWATHQWPTHDPYSFTVAGVPWLAFEWLGDVVVGMAAKAGGLLGLEDAADRPGKLDHVVAVCDSRRFVAEIRKPGL